MSEKHKLTINQTDVAVVVVVVVVVVVAIVWQNGMSSCCTIDHEPLSESQ